MREVTRYQAEDGTLFETEEEAIAHESGPRFERLAAAYLAQCTYELPKGQDTPSPRAVSLRRNVVIDFLAWLSKQLPPCETDFGISPDDLLIIPAYLRRVRDEHEDLLS